VVKSLLTASPTAKIFYIQKYCDSCKNNFTSKFSYLLFLQSHTHKTKTGSANSWETSNSKPLGPIIIAIAQSEKKEQH
jgi:hypothetical protein